MHALNLNNPAPAQAYAPDANRVSPGAPARLPEWFVHILALLIRIARAWALAADGGRSRPVPSWLHERPDLPLGSAQALAASVRGAFGNAIAWMCLRRGIGPGHPDWPELSRAIVAFGGSVKRFRAGLPACGLQWWENPDIIPGMIGEAVATPAATATAVLLSRLDVVDVPPPALIVAAAEVGHAVSTAPVRPVLARVTTGPPTGPPSRRDDQICYA